MTIIQFPEHAKGEYTVVPSSGRKRETGRSLLAIACQRTFLMAALGGFVSWSAMALQMSATPLAMARAGYSFAQVTTAVELHLLGMFVPSFFTGTLCHWLGSRFVMIIGLTTQLTGAMLFQRGFEIGHFHLGLIIVGVGWNLGYVGASALLSQAHRAEEKAKTHSLYEAIVMFSISTSFFSSAFAVTYFGWNVLTGRVVSIYLAVATSILILDTAYVAFRARDTRMEMTRHNEEITIK